MWLHRDLDPMETAASANGQARQEQAGSSEGIASLLALARQQINEGNPSLALQAVVMALRATGGEQAVLGALGRARELYQSGLRENAATDELSALFAECAIATLPPQPTATPVETNAADSASGQFVGHELMDTIDINGANGDSILAESGREQVVIDASSDGSSFVCQQCGGVVSNLRRDEHMSFWCSPPPS